MKRCPSSLMEHFRWVKKAVVVDRNEDFLFHAQALGWSFRPNSSLQYRIASNKPPVDHPNRS